MTEPQTPNPTAFDGWTLRSLKTHIEDLAPLVAELDDSELREEFRAEYEAAVSAFKDKSPYCGGDGDGDTPNGTSASTDTAGDKPTVEELITDAVGDDDHSLRHVESDEMTFSGRHTRTLDTTVEEGHVVHKVIEDYADDAHGESLSWARGLPQSCPHCDAALATDEDSNGGNYIEAADCPDCPFTVERVSVDAPVQDSNYMKPVTFSAAYVHDFDDEPDVDWDDMKSDLGEDTDLCDIANIVRSLSLTRELNAARDKAYDSDEGIQTVECGNCGGVVDAPAASTHAHFGEVCPDCEDVEVWSPDEADLPDDVRARMDTHKTFSPDRIVRMLRDVLYYANYRRTNLDDDEDADKIPDGITTGRGGKIDAHGMGRGVKGTGLRRPSGAFHNFAHWRTLLGDAKDTSLVERTDTSDVDDKHKNARWTATDKGREVFDELARCRMCGGRKEPYKHIHTYQSRQYTNKDTRLTLACADCDELSHSLRGMTISSSAGSYSHKELDGVDYDTTDE